MKQGKKHRLLLINDYEVGGGAEQVFCNHIKILGDACQVTEFVGSKENIAPGILQHFFSVKFFLRTLSVLKKEEPEIVHIHNFHNYLSPSILFAIRFFRAFSKGKPVVVYTAHDYHLLWPDALYGYYENNRFKKLEVAVTNKRFLLYSLSNKSWLISLYKKVRWFFNYKVLQLDREIDVVITPSAFLMDKFKTRFPKKKLLVIRNPAELKVSRQLNTCLPTKRALSRPVKLVFLGRLSIEKGLLEFIDLLHKEKISSFEFSIYGDGPIYKDIEAKIEDLGFKDQIFLKGRISHGEIETVLASQEVLVLPSICFENAPLVLVEGALKNLRLLTCNYGGMIEIGEICGAVYYFNYTEEGALRKAFEELDKVKDLPCRDIESIVRIFSFESYKSAHLSLYNTLLG